MARRLRVRRAMAQRCDGRTVRLMPPFSNLGCFKLCVGRFPSSRRGTMTYSDGAASPPNPPGSPSHPLFPAAALTTTTTEPPADRAPCYEGEWAGGRRHGEGTMSFADGRVYIGAWSGGDIHGRGLLSWPDGARYEGEFRGGVSDGRGAVSRTRN